MPQVLTPREILWMRKEKPATRVMMVANDLGCNIQRLAVHLIFDREFMQATTSNMQGLLDSYKACARIVDTPIPFPYAHMLAFILFVFVYFSPFVYMLSNSNPLLGIIPSEAPSAMLAASSHELSESHNHHKVRLISDALDRCEHEILAIHDAARNFPKILDHMAHPHKSTKEKLPIALQRWAGNPGDLEVKNVHHEFKRLAAEAEKRQREEAMRDDLTVLVQHIHPRADDSIVAVRARI